MFSADDSSSQEGMPHGGSDEGSRSQSLLQKHFDPKRVAYAIIATLQHSMISHSGLVTMLLIDAALHFYLAIVMILKQPANLSDLAATFNVIEGLVDFSSGDTKLIIAQAIILSLLVLLLGVIMFVIKSTHNSETLQTYPGIKKGLTLVLTSLMTFLQIPMLEVILSTFFIDYNAQIWDSPSTMTTFRLVLYILSCINLVLLSGMVILIQKIFITRIPSTSVQWAASTTQLHSMKLINRIFLVVCHLYVTTVSGGNQFIYLSIPALILFVGTGISRIMLIPHFSRAMEWIIRIKELLTGCLLLILVVAQLLTLSYNNSNAIAPAASTSSPSYNLFLCLFIAFVSIPSVIGLTIVLDYSRQKQLWSKLETGTLKLEMEFEYGLFLLMKRIQEALQSDDRNGLALADILYLIEIHNRGCTNIQCACHKRQVVQYLLAKSHTFNTAKPSLDDEEMQLLKGDTSNAFFQMIMNPNNIRQLAMLQTHNFYAQPSQTDPDTQGNLGNSRANLKGVIQSSTGASAAYRDRNKNGQQVNVQFLKQSFINRFAQIFFEDAKKRFPNSKSIFFQYLYFALYSYQNRFLTESLLRNFEMASGASASAQKRNSWIENVGAHINELYTIMEIDKLNDTRDGRKVDKTFLEFNKKDQYSLDNDGDGRNDNIKKNGNFSALSQFNPDYFTEINELSQQFYKEVEILAIQIQNFWKILQSESAEVDFAQSQSVSLADTIHRVFQGYKAIERASEGISGSRKSHDFKACYTFALVQKLLLNDVPQHDLYMSKMNSQREMLKLLKNNMMDMSGMDPDNTGFFMVQGQNKAFGKIILTNQKIRKELGYSSKDIDHMTINDFMPQLIKNWHGGFINDFNKNCFQTSNVLNKTQCVFFKKRNGYIVPVMMQVRFHYSRQHSFTFACFASFMKDVQVQRSAGSNRRKVEEVLFFLCDDYDWRIYDISESAINQLGLPMQILPNSDIETALFSLSIQDLCPGLSTRILHHMQEGSSNSFEETLDVDLNMIAGLGGHKGNRQKVLREEICQAQCTVFSEFYGTEKDKCMNVISLILLDDALVTRNQTVTPGKERQRQQNGSQLQLTQGIDDADIDLGIAPSAISGLDQRDQSSINYSGSSESHSSKEINDSSMLKQMNHSTDNNNQSSLRLVTQLILLVFIILLVVSTLNLILSLNRYTQLQSEVDTTRTSFKRVEYLGRSRMVIRSLINMANGNEVLTSNYVDDKFNTYLSTLANQLVLLKGVQDYLDTATFDYSDQFISMIQQKTTMLDYLDPYNKASVDLQQLAFSINLYVQRAVSLNIMNQSSFAGNISQLQIGVPPAGYSPTDNERNLYFLTQTLQDNIINNCIAESIQYVTETSNHALDISYKTEITIILSIISIIIVGVIVSPIIFRIQQRKYVGLRFLYNVEDKHIVTLEKQTRDFLHITFADPSVRPASSQIEALFNVEHDDDLKALFAQYNIGDMDPNTGSPRMDDTPFQELESTQKLFGMSRIAQMQVKHSQEDYSDGFSASSVGMSSRESDRTRTRGVKAIEEEFKDSHHNNRNSKKITTKKVVPLVPLEKRQGTFNDPPNIAFKLKRNQTNESQESQENGFGREVEKVEEGKEAADLNRLAELEEKQNYLQGVKNQKFQRIQQRLSWLKFQTFFYVTIIACLFTSYFVIAYFFSVQPFQQTPTIVNLLASLMFKGLDLENLIDFTRDDYILNTSIPYYSNNSVNSTDMYLSYVYTDEVNYLQLRKNPPTGVTALKDYLQSLETSQVCNIIFGAAPYTPRDFQNCQKSYNQMFSNGMTYAMNIIVSHFGNLNMHFESDKRTMSYLHQAIKDPDTQDLIETKLFVMNPIFSDIEDYAAAVANNYYATLIKQYAILYSVFILVMVVLFFLFTVYGYVRIKESMWKTNLTLKILPLDFVPSKCLQELKVFYKQ